MENAEALRKVSEGGGKRAAEDQSPDKESPSKGEDEWNVAEKKKKKGNSKKKEKKEKTKEEIEIEKSLFKQNEQ